MWYPGWWQFLPVCSVGFFLTTSSIRVSPGGGRGASWQKPHSQLPHSLPSGIWLQSQGKAVTEGPGLQSQLREWMQPEAEGALSQVLLPFHRPGGDSERTLVSW
jgi:hypothetical protein